MGRNIDIEFSTSLLSALLKTFSKRRKAMKNRFDSISTFAPKTASLFGVIPHSEILNKIAERAMPFTMTVTMDKANRIKLPVLFWLFFAVAAIENRIMAITPIKRRLKKIKKSLSL